MHSLKLQNAYSFLFHPLSRCLGQQLLDEKLRVTMLLRSSYLPLTNQYVASVAKPVSIFSSSCT